MVCRRLAGSGWMLAVMIAALAVGSAALAGRASAGEGCFPAERLQELVRWVEASAELPVGTRFRQEVTLRALFTTWQFESSVWQDRDGLKSETRGAPGFVPPSLPADLVGLMKNLDLFDLRVVELAEPGILVLRGPRIDYRGSGAKEATFWIDTCRGRIERAEAVFSWGTLLVRQEYLDLEGRLLLARQSARALPYGFTLEVAYRDYQIP
ncbi:MAG: hypothetical protein CW345_04105 [Firmicutes bacterium]|nr:hypothetical protein [Bacillota bacterium]